MKNLMDRPSGLNKFVRDNLNIDQDIGGDEHRHIYPPAK